MTPTITAHPLPGSEPCGRCWRVGRGWCVGVAVYLIAVKGVGKIPACRRCARRVGQRLGVEIPSAPPIDLRAVGRMLDGQRKPTREPGVRLDGQRTQW